MVRPVCCLLGMGLAASVGQPVEESAPLAKPWELDPNRTLSAGEAEELVRQVVVLLDKKARGGRDGAVTVLGQRIRHRAAFPALRAVVHDEEEDANLRLNAVKAMLGMGITEALGDVVRLLRSKDLQVRANAHRTLCFQYPPGRHFGFDRGKSVEHNEAAIKRWEEWWQANKDTFKLDMGPIVFDLL